MFHEHPFYGTEIIRGNEKAYIEQLLAKYKGMPATNELKKAIYDELQNEKHLGRIKIPFKVVFRNGQGESFPPCVEVILDTKV